jgi:flagellar hook-basal body complex protein FliE
MVERADINSVLGQMRALQAQAQQGIQAPAAIGGGVNGPERSGFGELLKSAVDSVNKTQAGAKKLTTAFERGEAGVDLPQVMIELQKASVSFQAMTQVRNKLVTAYEDIAKMPI